MRSVKSDKDEEQEMVQRKSLFSRIVLNSLDLEEQLTLGTI